MGAKDLYFTMDPPAVPVTTLLKLGDVLLSGEGSFLHLYDLKNGKKYYMKVLTSANIHGIQKNNNLENVHQLIIFGGRFFCTITFDLNFKLVAKSAEKQMTYWISDCCWVSYKLESGAECSGIVLYCSNNTLLLIHSISLQIVGSLECQESCILYSAKLLYAPDWGGIVAVGGTVFNQIIIWSAGLDSFHHTSLHPVLHRLTGHNGVILGLDWNSSRLELCSVSDDRSIRIQKMLIKGDRLEFESWKNCEFQPGLILFGHTARVWRAKLLDNVIVSIAEDATCAVWSCNDGRMLQKFVGHRGKNIFGLEVDDRKNEIYTGGSDGSIRKWKFTTYQDDQSSDQSEDLNLPIVIDPPMNQAKDFPRTIRLALDSKLLVMTDMGCLFMFDIISSSWVTLMMDVKYSSYCVLEVSGDVVAVANIHGWILLLEIKDTTCNILHEKQLFQGKILSIHWLNQNTFLTTGPDGDIVVCKVEKDQHRDEILTIISRHLLPTACQRWVSAGALINGSDVLICGDRMGSIHVYNFPTKEQSSPLKSFNKVFGSYGVTSVNNHDNQAYCCGKNGKVLVYSGSSADAVNIVHSFSVYKGFDWLSRIIFTDDGQYIIGFLSDKFVMFDVCSNRFLLSFQCGGGHRTWDFQLSSSHSKLAFIKKRQIILHQNTIKTKMSLIKPMQQGLGINSVLHLNSSSLLNGFIDTFVTSGEDGLLNFASVLSCHKDVEFSKKNENLSDVKVMSVKCHMSGLKAMTAIDITSSETFKKFLLFTAGAGGVIRAWDVKVSNEFCHFSSHDALNIENPSLNSQHGVLLKQLDEHIVSNKYKKGCKPWRHFEINELLEARFMTIDVLPKVGNSDNIVLLFTGCSLGFVRIFVFNKITNKFAILKEIDFHEHCLLKLKHCIYKNPLTEKEGVLLLSAATDGRIAFWDVTNDIENFMQNNSESDTTSNLSFSFQCHQSGINALDLLTVQGGHFLLGTGGDDNSIGLTSFDAHSVIKHNKHLTAHSSQITGIKLINKDHLLSVSIDQRIILWSIDQDFKLVAVQSVMLDVSDISDMLVVEYADRIAEKSYGVIVVGRGLQRIHLVQRAKDIMAISNRSHAD